MLVFCLGGHHSFLQYLATFLLPRFGWPATPGQNWFSKFDNFNNQLVHGPGFVPLQLGLPDLLDLSRLYQNSKSQWTRVFADDTRFFVAFYNQCSYWNLALLTQLKDDRMENSINGSRYRHILRYSALLRWVRKAVRDGPPLLPLATPYPTPTQSAAQTPVS